MYIRELSNPRELMTLRHREGKGPGDPLQPWGLKPKGQAALSRASPESAGMSEHWHNPAPGRCRPHMQPGDGESSRGQARAQTRPSCLSCAEDSFQGKGKPRAHLNARKFCLHARSLAMECAQPSVNLLLNSLESSEREEPWRQSTAVSDHPSPG